MAKGPLRLRVTRLIPKLRYLVPFDTARLPQEETDVLVLGCGLAGIRAALEARRRARRVFVISKGRVDESNSSYAQGGIAAAVSEKDSADLHVQDTFRAGMGLNDPEVVRNVIEEGIECVKELVAWGIPFDRLVPGKGGEEGGLRLALEGGHQVPRILHRGDVTGMAITVPLIRLAMSRGVKVQEGWRLIDLLSAGSRCLGGLFLDDRGGLRVVRAGQTILATGGAGQLYRETTNPRGATGDGMACSLRAGCPLVDMEFVQFHPTALYLAGAARVLISEAVRGAGAVLRDRTGRAFMKDYHERADLAPRDVVSRAILKQMQLTGDTRVYLDVGRLVGPLFSKRFPSLDRVCRVFGIDPRREWIPVRPAAHYTIGGVRADAQGETCLEGLFAVGECSGTFFHGANRLASNSLLECVVFGRRAGALAGERAGRRRRDATRVRSEGRLETSRFLDPVDLANSLKSLMWRSVGIERDGKGLRDALEQIRYWSRYVLGRQYDDPAVWELQNMLTVALCMARSALAREESRGVHFRTDFPEPSESWRRHIETML